MVLFWISLTITTYPFGVLPNYFWQITIAIQLAIIGLLVLLFRPFAAENNNSLGTFFVVSVASIDIVSGWLNVKNFYDDLPQPVLIILASLLFSRIKFFIVLKALQTALILVLTGGWIVELFGFNAYIFPSGFPLNILGHRWMGLISHPNAAGFICAIAFGLSLFVTKSVLQGLLSLSTLFFTEHRGGVLAAGLISLFALMLYRDHLSKVAKFLTSGALLLVIASVPIALQARTGSDDFTSGREMIWSMCASKLSNLGPLGDGPLALARQLGGDKYALFIPFHCHNQLLDDLVNYGYVFGLLPTLIMLMSTFVAVKNRNTLAVPLLGVFWGGAAFEAIIRPYVSMSYVWLTLFCYLSIAQLFNRSVVNETLTSPQVERQHTLK